MKLPQTLLTIILIFSSIILSAQNYVDLLKMEYSYSPNNRFDSGKDSTYLADFNIDATIPIKLKNGINIISGIYYEHLRSRIFPQFYIDSLQSLMLKIGLNTQLSEKWNGTFLLLPKTAGSTIGITSNHIQFGAVALLKYDKSENLKYKVGLYYNDELFGPFIVPIVGLYYLSPSKKFEANVNLPISVDLNYKVYSNITTGLNFKGVIRSYYWDKDFVKTNYYIARANNEVFGYIQTTFANSFVIQGKVGYAVGRSLRIYNTNDQMDLGISALKLGDNRRQLNEDYADGMVFKIRMIYRFNLHSNN